MISLKTILNEAESFTAINKDSGKVSVFKSKEARDSAIKQGTHDAKDDKAAKGGDSSAGKDVPKVNIFDKPKEEPKSEPTKAKFKDFKRDIESTMTDMGFSSADLGGLDGVEDFEDSDGNYVSISKGKVFGDDNKFSVMGGKVDDRDDVDTDTNYQSFNSKEDAIAYAKELAGNLKGGKEEPKSDKSSEPAKDSTGDRAGNLEVNKTVRAKAKKLGITPAKLGKDEYKLKMSQAAVEALTDANFHSEARALIAKLEGKPEWAEKPTDMPDVTSDEYDEWRKTSVYSSKYYDADDTVMDLGTTASQESSWDGQDALDSIAFDLKMNGFKNLASTLQSVIKESKSTSLTSLLPESVVINEGTRSQVGLIDGGGKIVSAYVHFDGYPSNMKPGLKKHMKDAKDVLTLIKKGGARGIFDDKEIEYYNSGTPMKGDSKDIQGYIKDADMKTGAEFVYLYNTKDKKWYYADTYKDTKLKKLF